MSEYLSKKAVLEWLESEMSINKGHPDDIDIHWTLNKVSKKILSGAFDTPERREICPDHPDEKPQVSSSHTWTQDGNTYFVSYVEYCPTCYHVISTSARL